MKDTERINEYISALGQDLKSLRISFSTSFSALPICFQLPAHGTLSHASQP